MSDVVSPFPTWLTYQQVAERLGLRSASAAAARARRAKWPRRIRNDTLEAEVCVPTEVLAAAAEEPPRRVDDVFVGEASHHPDRAGRVLDASLVFNEPRTGTLASDHYGLCVDIAWPTRPSTPNDRPP